MKTLSEIKKILAEHRHELHEKYHVQRISIFGSYARGDQTAGSDIDILVEFDAPIGWEIVDLRDDLEKMLDRKVDLATREAVARKPLLWESVREDLVNV